MSSNVWPQDTVIFIMGSEDPRETIILYIALGASGILGLCIYSCIDPHFKINIHEEMQALQGNEAMRSNKDEV